jgi:antitoxin (DNA-binding transcriptional repressor) of toxin-antitoxin stability system
MIDMKTAGVREVKDRLSEFIRMVRNGEHVLITDRGEVVAMLGPPGPAFEEAEFPRLEQMIREGRATRGAPNRPGLYPLQPKRVTHEQLMRLLDEERSDRV